MFGKYTKIQRSCYTYKLAQSMECGCHQQSMVSLKPHSAAGPHSMYKYESHGLDSVPGHFLRVTEVGLLVGLLEFIT